MFSASQIKAAYLLRSTQCCCCLFGDIVMNIWSVCVYEYSVCWSLLKTKARFSAIPLATALLLLPERFALFLIGYGAILKWNSQLHWFYQSLHIIYINIYTSVPLYYSAPSWPGLIFEMCTYVLRTPFSLSLSVCPSVLPFRYLEFLLRYLRTHFNYSIYACVCV